MNVVLRSEARLVPQYSIHFYKILFSYVFLGILAVFQAEFLIKVFLIKKI